MTSTGPRMIRVLAEIVFVGLQFERLCRRGGIIVFVGLKFEQLCRRRGIRVAAPNRHDIPQAPYPTLADFRRKDLDQLDLFRVEERVARYALAFAASEQHLGV